MNIRSHPKGSALDKVLLVMKLTTVLIVVFTLQASANLMAQKIHLQMENATLREVLQEIRKQSGYSIMANSDLLRKSVPVSVKSNGDELIAVLEEVFQHQPIDYELREDLIVLKESTVLQSQIPVRGVVSVTNARGEITPQEGVNIVERGTTNRAVTNRSGEYHINVRRGAILVFSMLGHTTREISVTNQTTLNLTLVEDVSGLDEVVVTGYQTQERRTITGAMSRVQAQDFEDMPIQTLDQAMQGRMAGVLVQGGSGVPGAAMRIEIRGVGSITAGTDPLYIVDGVEINTEVDDQSDVSSSNPLASIDPEDIESIEVLKDAAAASIYGAQAANGVVLITTKKGTVGTTRINFNYYKGVREPMPLMEVMNTQQYLRTRLEAVQNFNPTWSEEEVRGEVLSQSQLSPTLTDAELAALPTYDWQSEAFQVGHTDYAQLTLSGGSGATTFRISSSFNTTDATVIGNDFTRGTARVRIDHEVNSKFRITGNVNLSTRHQNSSYRSDRSGSWFSAPQTMAPQMLPFLPIYNEDGTLNAQGDMRFPGQYPYNPIHAATVNTIHTKTNGLLGVLNATYDISSTLRWQSRVGLNYRTMGTELYFDPRTQQVYARGGTKTSRMQTSSTLNTSHILTYNQSFFGGHNVNGLLGVEYRGYDRHRLGAFGEGFPSPEFRYLSSAALFGDVYENITGNRRAGVFGQINYNFMKKYMFSAVLRRDGSSKFGKDHRWGWFPAVSAGWDIAQENFLRTSRLVQQLKLRASYGHTGNSSIGNFAGMALWSGGGAYAGRPGTWWSQLGNEDLRWERNISTNLGLDFSLFNRRLYGAVDAYHRISDDLLLRTPISNLSGFTSIYRNTGAVVNQGIEIQLSSEILRQGNFKWNAGFNIAFNKNEVTHLYRGIVEDQEDPDSDGGFEEELGEEVTVLPGNAGIRKGWPMRTNWRYQYAGVNAATGKPMWWQGENRITYSPTGSWAPHGRGNRLSDYFGGFHSRFTYKRVEVGVFFQYDGGRELYNTTNTYLMRNGRAQSNTLTRDYLERWTTPGQITPTPRPIDGGVEELAAQHNRSSSLFLEDASYMRLKEVSLNWRVPNRYTNRLGLRTMTVYARALNLLTFTKWSGYDPEFYVDDSNFGTNTGQIPQAKTYTLGVRVGI